MRRAATRWGVFAIAALALACSGHRRVERRPAPAWRWPPEDPRVELEEIIGNRLGGGGFWRRITGEAAPTVFHRPYSAAWDGDALVVTDPGARRVVRLDSRGRLRTTAPDLVEGPIGVAVCTEGIVVTDSRRGRVLLLSEDLKLVRRLADGLSRPTGVACSEGRIFVAETGRHRIVQLSGGRSSALATVANVGRRGEGEGEFNFPTALTMAGGTLWVGDTLNFRVQQLAPSGEFLKTFGALGDAPGEMPRIKGLAVDRLGQLWISDGQTDRVSVYRKDGTFLMSLGATGSGDGEFSFPAGIASHPDGRVAIVDSLNRRMAIYRILGSDPPEGAP